MRSGLDGEMKRRWESESLYISPDGCISRHLGHGDEADRMGYTGWRVLSACIIISHMHKR